MTKGKRHSVEQIASILKQHEGDLTTAEICRQQHRVRPGAANRLPRRPPADLIDDMPAHEAAAIVEEMASDHRADVLGEMAKEESDAILEHLEEEDAEEARRLISYPVDTAGGLMMTEFAAYPMSATVREVVEDLTGREGDYTFLTVHYVYVVIKKHRLKGVLRLRDMVFADPDARIGDIVQRG